MADVYVFCVLGDESGAVPDPLDLADWQFYVVANFRARPREANSGQHRRAALGSTGPMCHRDGGGLL